MKTIKLLFALLSVSFFACNETNTCQKIDKVADCLKYSNCNVLENWRLNKIEKSYKCKSQSYTEKTLLYDRVLMYKNGALELRVGEKLSPLNKWKFIDCTQLKLYSTSPDTSLTLTVKMMEANEMRWEYTKTDTCTVANTLFLTRM